MFCRWHLVSIEHTSNDELFNLANQYINEVKGWLVNYFLELNITKSNYFFIFN